MGGELAATISPRIGINARAVWGVGMEFGATHSQTQPFRRKVLQRSERQNMHARIEREERGGKSEQQGNQEAHHCMCLDAYRRKKKQNMRSELKMVRQSRLWVKHLPSCSSKQKYRERSGERPFFAEYIAAQSSPISKTFVQAASHTRCCEPSHTQKHTPTWISATANSEMSGVTNCRDFLAASICPENTNHLHNVMQTPRAK